MSDQASRIGQEQGPTKTDPTALTTDALHREVAQARELLETEIRAMGDVAQANIDANLRVNVVMLEAIQRQLTFLETQRIEQKKDTKDAVDAALAAAKEAVNITATNTKEQIASLSTSFTTTMNAFGEKLDDVKNSVTRSEGTRGGLKEGWGFLVGGVGFISTLIAIAYALSR